MVAHPTLGMPLAAPASSSGGLLGGVFSNPWFYAVFSAVSLIVGATIGI
jgi:hypothetical protein